MPSVDPGLRIVGGGDTIPQPCRATQHGTCCACSTQSELVVPILHPASGATVAVLDCDSDLPAAFDAVDQQQLEALAGWLAAKYFTNS